MVAASTGPATTCSTRPSGAQKYAATLPPCFWPLTILNVATFWKDEQKYSLTYLPTCSFARAFTRSASALFQVSFGSSNRPETCSTKTSFWSFLACLAASDGVSKNCTAVPWSPQPTVSAFFSLAAGALSAGRSLPFSSLLPASNGASESPAAVTNARERMPDLLHKGNPRVLSHIYRPQNIRVNNGIRWLCNKLVTKGE